MSSLDLKNGFLTAARNGDLERLRECVEKYGVDVNCVGNKKYTALHKACSKNHLDCVKYLIEQGADVNAAAENNITPLHVAAEGAHVEVIRVLITRVSDVNKCTQFGGDTPLHWLVKDPPTGGRNTSEDIKQIINILYKHGANLNATNADENSTALHLCVKNKCPEIIKELLRLNADPTIPDKDFITPYKLAIFQGSEEETAKAFKNASGVQNVEIIEADGCQAGSSRVITSKNNAKVQGSANQSNVACEGCSSMASNQSPSPKTSVVNINAQGGTCTILVGDQSKVQINPS